MRDALIKAIGALLDDVPRSPLSGVIVYTSRGETHEIPFTADALTGKWEYKYRSKPRVMSRDHLGTVRERRGSRIVSVEEGSDRIPFELRIAFPLALLIWDRQGDEWRMVSAEEEGNVVTVNLTHREFEGLQATLTVDMERRLAVRFVTPVDDVALVVADLRRPGAFAAYEKPPGSAGESAC
ncbi:hypothetical protein [Cryobacterium sp. AP23]